MGRWSPSRNARNVRRRRSSRNRAVRRVLGKPVVAAAIIVTSLALIHPAHGTGYNVCLWHGMTDLPCPGCGMSRSVSCAVRGQFIDSVGYHPFGLIVLIALLSAACVALVPRALRQRVLRGLLGRSTWITALYVGAVVGFVTFGVARVLWSLR